MSAPSVRTGLATGLATGRWELVRALGATVLTPPPQNRAVCAALDLPEQSAADHTAAFVLGLPPHAAVYLGPEGKLGGEGLDRVGGFWRALGMTAPEDADHLGVLLLLYAELGEVEDAATDERTRAGIAAARAALFEEHIWSWAPAYLAALEGLEVDSVTAWARLTQEVLAHERSLLPPAERLPLALREAPPPAPAGGVDDVLDALVCPVRSGVIVSQRDVQRYAAAIGVGFRRGERRFAIKAMLEQDAEGTLALFADVAAQWAARHAGAGNDPVSGWWAERARAFAARLSATRAEPSPAR